jgi:hypothetical protein
VQLLIGGGEGGFEPGDFAEPTLALCLSDAGLQVVANLDEAFPLGWVRPKLWASDAAMLMRARGAEVTSADTEGDLTQLEGQLSGVTGAGTLPSDVRDIRFPRLSLDEPSFALRCDPAIMGNDSYFQTAAQVLPTLLIAALIEFRFVAELSMRVTGADEELKIRP